ncbi:MAG: hypothetical protein RDV48_30800 [Candidatus Eremiobacteraeota bacterium]|nr:hypothetical protein [Candidatus Eremiobacteraeota bacterium]
MDENEIIHETRWNIFRRRAGPATGSLIISCSKFLLNEATVDAEEIIQEWPSWDSDERLDFVMAFAKKHPICHGDQEILRFLMEQAEPLEISYLLNLILELPEKEAVYEFLVKQISEIDTHKIDFMLAEFFNAIGRLGCKDAIPLLISKINSLLNSPEFCRPGADSFNSGTVCIEAIAALCSLDRRNEYMELLKGFKEHPNKELALLALHKIRRLLR